MSVLRRLAVLAFAAVCLVPVAANAVDDNDIPDHVAFSSVSTLLRLCGGDAAILSKDACKKDYYAQNAAALDSALRDALDKAPANVQPLLKRDQYWFGETVRSAVLNGTPEREMRDHMLIPRIVTLAQIAKGLPRDGVLGKWANAFRGHAGFQHGHEQSLKIIARTHLIADHAVEALLQSWRRASSLSGPTWRRQSQAIGSARAH